jgi:hypothetical protein
MLFGALFSRQLANFFLEFSDYFRDNLAQSIFMVKFALVNCNKLARYQNFIVFIDDSVAFGLAEYFCERTNEKSSKIVEPGFISSLLRFCVI